MLDFDKQGPLNDEEIKSFLIDYNKNGRHYWQTQILTGDENIDRFVNEVANRFGLLTDRLALTIDRLYSQLKSREEITA